jgi:tRNA nucleotidyltransferase (CCA-adding enzyme)
MTGKGQSEEEVAERTSADKMRNLVEQARSAGAPTDQSSLSLNGNDIVGMGVKPGPQVGQILRQLTNDVVEDPALNDRDALTQRAQEYVNALPQGS